MLKSLEKKNVEFVIPFQLDSINGKNGIINELIVKDLNNNKKKLILIFFFLFLDSQMI